MSVDTTGGHERGSDELPDDLCREWCPECKAAGICLGRRSPIISTTDTSGR